MSKTESRLADVDISVLDELEELGEERAILLERMEKLEGDYRETITDVVYRRVSADYRGRLGAIDDKARPLHRQAAEAWTTLARLRSTVRAESETIGLDVEELKLRQALGEFTEAEVEERLADMEREREAREKLLAEAEEIDARFERVVEASGGSAASLRPAAESAAEVPGASAGVDEDKAEQEADEEAEEEADEGGGAEAGSAPDEESGGGEPAGAPAAAAAAASAASGREAEPDDDATTVEATGGSVPPGASAPAGATGVPPVPGAAAPAAAGASAATTRPVDGAPDATTLPADIVPPQAVRTPADFADAVTAEIPKVRVPVAAEAPAEDDGKTRIARPAKLVLEEPLHGVEEFRIHPLTLIGRTPQCQIQLDHLSVSRRHAQITLMGDEGYVLEDLGSENGVFVNGSRSERKVLADGDRVLIGTVSMRFRAPE